MFLVSSSTDIEMTSWSFLVKDDHLPRCKIYLFAMYNKVPVYVPKKFSCCKKWKNLHIIKGICANFIM